MTQLEQELDAAHMQTQLRKTAIMMEYISTLEEKVCSSAHTLEVHYIIF
ncbi:hypothetical protein HanPI659440_Chr01g0007871 [Helianthus annuus]|nr:hypothetical protein HanPI659440_Chr01g0007871 [Helianthus annuus]